MDSQLISIGFGNLVVASRVKLIIGPESTAIKRIVAEARERGELFDVTHGRRTRAVIITDSGHVILAASQPKKIANRVIRQNGNLSDEESANAE